MMACIEPEKKRSITERQRRAEEEKAKRDEAVERKCAMMLSNQEARGNIYPCSPEHVMLDYDIVCSDHSDIDDRIPLYTSAPLST